MKNSNWKQRQARDPWVKKAKQAGYFSRASFKLLELNEKDKLLFNGAGVVDLGAAPGGWSQVALEKVGKSGWVVAIDLLDQWKLAEKENLAFIQGDFTDIELEEKLVEKVNNRSVDLVMSDMAPNISGIKLSDQARSIYLVELALDFAKKYLSPKGSFVVKVFQGVGFDEYLRAVRLSFEQVKVRKPAASRPDSREVYLVAKRPKANG